MSTMGSSGKISIRDVTNLRWNIRLTLAIDEAYHAVVAQKEIQKRLKVNIDAAQVTVFVLSKEHSGMSRELRF